MVLEGRQKKKKIKQAKKKPKAKQFNQADL